MPTILRNLRIKTIGFVDKGANGKSPVVFIKRAKEAAAMSFEEKLQKSLDDIRDTVLAAVSKEESGASQTPMQLLETALESTPEDKKAAILSAFAAMQMAPPPAPAAEPVAPKADPEGEAPITGPDSEPKGPEVKAEGDNPEDKKPEDMEKLMKDLSPEARTLIEKIATDSAADVKKLAGEIEKLAKSNEDLRKELGETGDVVAKQAAEKEHGEMLEVAKRYPLVKGDFGKRATMLTTLKKSDPKAYDEMLETLASAQELGKKGMSETGTSRSGGDAGDTSEAKLEGMAKARAAEIVKSATKRLSAAKAYTRAYAEVRKENPDLCEAAQAEQQ